MTIQNMMVTPQTAPRKPTIAMRTPQSGGGGGSKPISLRSKFSGVSTGSSNSVTNIGGSTNGNGSLVLRSSSASRQQNLSGKVSGRLVNAARKESTAKKEKKDSSMKQPGFSTAKKPTQVVILDVPQEETKVSTF